MPKPPPEGNSPSGGPVAYSAGRGAYYFLMPDGRVLLPNNTMAPPGTKIVQNATGSTLTMPNGEVYFYQNGGVHEIHGHGTAVFDPAPQNVLADASTVPQFAASQTAVANDTPQHAGAVTTAAPPSLGGSGAYGVSGGYGGGGTQTVTSTPAATKAATVYNQQQLESQYGYAASFFGSDKSLSDLIKQATKEQWTPQEFASRLMGTSWYKTHSASQRQWTQLVTADPTEAHAQRVQMVGQISNLASKNGITLDYKTLQSMAYDALQFGWNPNQINSALAAHFTYTTAHSSATSDTIKQEANQYLVPMSDQAIQDWGQKLISGSVDDATFQSYLKAQAKSLFPGLSAAIDSGVTVLHYVDPYGQLAVQNGVAASVNDINWQDPKWQKALFQTDPKTGARTSMSLADWQTTLRTDPAFGYAKTNQAKQSSADLATQLTQLAGAS